MTEADILATTYDDTVTVYRPVRERKSTGETVFKSETEGKRVYESILCALSSKRGGKLMQSDSTASAEVEYTLFARPEADIRANDYLEISRLGQLYRMIAGEGMRYSSHSEIPLKPCKERV